MHRNTPPRRNRQIMSKENAFLCQFLTNFQVVFLIILFVRILNRFSSDGRKECEGCTMKSILMYFSSSIL